MKAQGSTPEPSRRTWMLTRRRCLTACKWGNLFARGRRGSLVDVGVLVGIRCAGCAFIFYICESEYRGQIYGSGRCRQAGRRAANARHQASPEGRLDHRDAMRARRARGGVAVGSVTDTRSDNLLAEASSCPRDDASASVMEAHAVIAESTDDGTNVSDDAAPGARDARGSGSP